MLTSTLAPAITGKRLSNTHVVGHGLTTFLLTGQHTGGAFSLVEVYSQPGAEPPYHIHQNEDETFYILEGRVAVMVVGEVTELGPGGVAFLPRGLPHTFRIRSASARGLLIVTPSGFEDYFKSIGAPAASLELPKPELRPDYFEAAGRAAELHGVRLAAEQPQF